MLVAPGTRRVSALGLLANESCCRNYSGSTADGWLPDTIATTPSVLRPCGAPVGPGRSKRSITDYLAPILHIGQWLANAQQVIVNLWVGIHVVLQLVTDIAARLTLQAGEVVVDVGMCE